MAAPKTQHNLTWYRKEHAAIPASAYDFKWKASQVTRGGVVYKNNYAPLGRIPTVVKTDKGARRKYELAHDTLTAKGYAGLPKKKKKAYRPPYGVPEKYTYYMTLNGTVVSKKKATSKKKSAKKPVTLDEAMGKAMRYA